MKVCKCHGEPMKRNGHQVSGIPRWMCNVRWRERKARDRANAPGRPCACGCGELTKYEYVHGHYARSLEVGTNWRGGRSVQPNGYVRVWMPDHPVANKHGYALEHRYVLHEAGIEIPDGSHVHHLNGDKTDNRLDNLEVLAARDHFRLHNLERGYIVNQYGEWPLRS